MDLSLLNFATIAPMITFCIFGIGLLCVSIFIKDLAPSFYAAITFVAIVLALGLILGVSSNLEFGFFGLVIIDDIAVVAVCIMLVSSLFFIAMSSSKLEFYEYTLPEFFVLFLFMLVGYCFMVVSLNLMVIFVGLEVSSLALYALIALHNRAQAISSALKYFVMGAMGSGFFVFGAAIIYLASGSVDIGDILTQKYTQSEALILSAGAVFIVVSVGFKLSLVPFHTWLADVYEGASEVMAGFVSIVPKVSGFVVAIRLFGGLIFIGFDFMQDLLIVLAVATMTFGNLAALIQKDIKRMLAFSSISHAGYILAALVVGNDIGVKAIFVYWIMFSIANIGAFCMLWIYRTKQTLKRFDHPFERYKGLIATDPFMALAMSLFMLSLAGIPPFSVFWGKFSILLALIDSKFFILALIVVLNSALGMYYYLKVVVFMLLKEGDELSLRPNYTTILGAVVLICSVLSIIGIFGFKFLSSAVVF